MDELQELANKVNLGKHQHLINATDEEGRAGRWIVHRPNMRDEIRIGVLYSQLKTPEDSAAPADIDAVFDNTAFMCATLTVVTDQRPDWFPADAAECLDGPLIEELFMKFCEWKECFRRPVSAAPGEDRSAAESA